MAERTLPGLGLTGFWDLGANNWKGGMDLNLRKLSLLVQLSVLSMTTPLPSTGLADGMIYIIPSGGDAKKIAIRDNGAWVNYDPTEGMVAWVKDTDKFVKYDGTNWVNMIPDVTSPPLVINNQADDYTLVLADAANGYIRMTAATAKTLIVPNNSAVAFEVGTQIPVRQAGAGQIEILGGSGVQINTSETRKLRKQHSTATLIKVAANEWDLTGDLEVQA